MSSAVLAAVITGILNLLGVVITVRINSRRTEEGIRTSQAVMDTRIDELTREVREHNNYARRVPVMEEQIKVINHRIADLEDIIERR